ncbi:hypothetical protein R6Q59_027174 [Mikania micrantha]
MKDLEGKEKEKESGVVGRRRRGKCRKKREISWNREELQGNTNRSQATKADESMAEEDEEDVEDPDSSDCVETENSKSEETGGGHHGAVNGWIEGGFRVVGVLLMVVIHDGVGG